MATPTLKPKLHGRMFYESIGSPKYVLAPMVDQSEFAWRLLTRSFLPPDLRSSILAYTPMFHAKLFAESPKYRNAHFEALKEDGEKYLDGNEEFDRPLFVQFCANDPEHLLGGAKQVQQYCDAVDLNLGCPQGIAKRGHYGAFLQEDWGTIHKLIRTLHENLDVPVTAKMRILETKERTLEYAKMILDAGASIITVHGRQREQKGHYTGLADWAVLRYLRENLPPETVIFANGNVLQHADIGECLEATKVDGVMSAEGNLYDPSIFAAPSLGKEASREYWCGRDGKGGYRADAVLRRYMDIIHKFVMHQDPPQRLPLFLPGDSPAVQVVSDPVAADRQSEEPMTKKRKLDEGSAELNGVEDNAMSKKPKANEANLSSNEPASAVLTKKQKRKQQAKEKHQQQPTREKVTNANLIAMQAHCFHMLRSLVSKHHEVRDALAHCKAGDIDAYENVLTLTEAAVKEGLLAYGADPLAFEERSDLTAVADIDSTESSLEAVRRCKRPYWVCQPYVRPLPKEALEKGSVQLSKKQLRKMEEEKIGVEKAGVSPGGKVGVVEEEVRREVLSVEDGVADAAAAVVPKEGMVCG
ncbi:hypothetical protein LTR62_005807 [Meristemomyces frigidus]|uniref:tRNA-dihydrouridine(16/17) synthase [NAD(P)(+)] n=1 Tax=Meristemomyces frigidus TaxID=1508187 RepID=A0AAN7YIY5_9PEZI|nr:hypothetical protein LTR62_005807 [Meristemomyces frigidus]